MPKSLRVELPRKRRHAELLHCVGDDLCARVVHSQRGVVVLVDEDLQRLQQGEDRLLADLAATADAIFLRAHVQQCDQRISSSLPIRMPEACGPQISLPPLKVTMSNPIAGYSHSRSFGGTSAEASLKV